MTLNRADLRNRIRGCWMGKSIGGTLGTPFEGRREIQNVTGYTLDHCPPERKVTVEITASRVERGVNRGILEIVAPGRPTVGLVPLVFMSA